MNVTCNKCGWVYYAVTREMANGMARSFQEWFDAQPSDVQEMYYGKPYDYEHCWCGSNSFRPSVEGDCPDGCTVSPVVYEVEIV